MITYGWPCETRLANLLGAPYSLKNSGRAKYFWPIFTFGHLSLPYQMRGRNHSQKEMTLDAIILRAEISHYLTMHEAMGIGLDGSGQELTYEMASASSSAAIMACGISPTSGRRKPPPAMSPCSHGRKPVQGYAM